MCFLVAVDNFCAAITRFEPRCFRENVRLLQISPTYFEPIVPRKLSSDGRVISKHSLDKYTHMFCDFRLSNPRYLAHQDIEARTMLVDPETDILISFNFSYSGRISGIGYGKD